MKDVSDYVYMSESLIKKKLLSEKTSFSRILLDVRMISAKKMLEQGHSVMTVSEKCGYASTSYFISIFRQYFSITPRRYSEKWFNKQLYIVVLWMNSVNYVRGALSLLWYSPEMTSVHTVFFPVIRSEYLSFPLFVTVHPVGNQILYIVLKKIPTKPRTEIFTMKKTSVSFASSHSWISNTDSESYLWQIKGYKHTSGHQRPSFSLWWPHHIRM